MEVKRPGPVTALAVLHFISAVLMCLAGAALVAGASFAFEGEAELAPTAGAICIGIALAQLVAGVGLLQLRPYGRTIQIVLAVIGLLAVPFGTMISICVLVYMLKPGIKLLFSGRPVLAMTPDEAAEIARLSQGSVAGTIVLVIVVLLVGVMGVGIIAAIALPRLLLARMAANEAGAISALRTINNAQMSYASTAGKGGFAVALRVLAAPCPGSSSGFVPSDLSEDPSHKTGYVISLESADAPLGPTDCNGRPTESNYYATAVPTTPGTTAIRGFSTASAGKVFFSNEGTAPSRMSTITGTAREVQ